MAYSQFTSIHSVRTQLGVQVTYKKLFSEVEEIQPSAFLLEALERTTLGRMAYFSEKSRSEAIVFPILSEFPLLYLYQLALYSGANIEGDKEKGLNGECDFVFSTGEQGIELERPIFCVVEAKDHDIDLGIPQCIAQLVGAKLFNEKGGISQNVYYGAVTTGADWTFLKMEGNLVTIDIKDYSLAQLPLLLGVLNQIINIFIQK